MSDATSRWWEGYAIRYGVGTVVGGIAFALLCSMNESLKPFLFGASGGSFQTSHIILFGAYGFTYCYLASAPILVFHTSRWLFGNKFDLDRTIFVLLLVLSVPLIVAQILHSHIVAGASSKELIRISAFIFALVFWMQFLLLVKNLSNTSALFSFYEKLSQKRKPHNAQLVESYRHLREHGNAFFVVLLEIILAIVLYGTGLLLGDDVSAAPKENAALAYVLVILLWSGPAAIVWMLGNRIERQLLESD